jgi:hypothetical protein
MPGYATGLLLAVHHHDLFDALSAQRYCRRETRRATTDDEDVTARCHGSSNSQSSPGERPAAAENSSSTFAAQ